MPPKKDNAPAKKDAKVTYNTLIQLIGRSARPDPEDGMLFQDSDGSKTRGRALPQGEI